MATFCNLAGKAGFEPATNRLTAERTTSVLLTLNFGHKKAPVYAEASFLAHRNKQRISSVRELYPQLREK